MRFKFNNFNAFMIHENNDGFYISDCNGFVMEYEQALKVGNGLIEFAEKHKKDIKNFNERHLIEFENRISKINKSTTRKKNEGYVYLFKCGDKYKIGYSKNPKERLKQLDCRPYALEFVTQSKSLQNAYLIEQELHKKYEKYRINGEWYLFNYEVLNEIKIYLENLERRDNHRTEKNV